MVEVFIDFNNFKSKKIYRVSFSRILTPGGLIPSAQVGG